MSKHLVFKFPDDQLGEHHALYIATVFCPDGPRHLACDDILWNEDNRAYEAVVYRLAPGQGLEDELETFGETMATWPRTIPFCLVHTEAYERKSTMELAEEQLERQQEGTIFQRRVQGLFKKEGGEHDE